MIAAGRAGAGRGVRRQGLPRACGTSCATSATRSTASTSASASATTATTPARYARRLRRAPRRPRLLEVDLPRRRTASTSRPVPRRPRGCRARRAACRSATSSTRRRSTAATTSSPPATTSTTRPRCCSATSLRWDDEYLGRQLPVLPARATASPARSSRWCGWASGRRRRTACCGASTTIVEECPMAAGNKHLGYKEALNAIEEHVARAPSTTSTSAFLDRASRPVRAEAGRARATDSRPAPRAGRRPPARCARSAGWSSAPRAPPVQFTGRKGRTPRLSRVLSAGRAGAARRLEGPPLPRHPRRGRRVPHPRRARAPRRPHRPAGGRDRSRVDHGRPLHGASGRRWPTSSSRCPAAPRSSIRRTSGRS